MRASFLAVLLILTVSLAAGERPVLGVETVLGDAARAPLPDVYDWLTPFVATDGDGFVVAWEARRALYVQRFDRQGRPLGGPPTLLLVRPEFTSLWVGGLVSVGGVYHLFYNDTREAWVLRLTREGEVIERRRLFADVLWGITHIGNEILATNDKRMVRMREDLSVIEEIAGGGWRFIDSPRGVVALQSSAGSTTARYLDGSEPVRLPVGALVWSGTEFLGATGGQSVIRFDAQLKQIGSPVPLSVCCYIQDLVVVGPDRVFVTAHDVTTGGVIVDRGVPVTTTPVILGERARTIRTADQLLFSVDRRLNARLFSESFAYRTAPVSGEVRIAADELIGSGTASATEVAVARLRIPANDSERREVLVSILDHEGRLLREVSLGTAWLPKVALGHDGHDFYALIQEVYGAGWFRRVDPLAAPVRLPVRVIPMLAWNGFAFVIAQDGYRNFEGNWQYLRRFLWLHRDGTLAWPPCPNWSFFGGNDVRVFNPGPSMVVVAGTYINATVQPFTAGCPDGPPADRLPHLQLAAKVAWQNGKWAVVRTGPNVDSIDLALSDDITTGLGPWHTVASLSGGYGDATIAPIEGKWLVLWRRLATVHASIVDERGFLSGTRVVAPDVRSVDDTLLLVPLSRERVLAVYRRPLHDAPYTASTRVVAVPLTVETTGSGSGQPRRGNPGR